MKKLNGNSTLRPIDVIKIREAIESGRSTVKIEAELHGVGRESIRRLMRRETFDKLPRVAVKTEEQVAAEGAAVLERLLETAAKARAIQTGGDKMLGELTQQPLQKED